MTESNHKQLMHNVKQNYINQKTLSKIKHSKHHTVFTQI
jgi:hypothetical protein